MHTDLFRTLYAPIIVGVTVGVTLSLISGTVKQVSRLGQMLGERLKDLIKYKAPWVAYLVIAGCCLVTTYLFVPLCQAWQKHTFAFGVISGLLIAEIIYGVCTTYSITGLLVEWGKRIEEVPPLIGG